MAVFLFPILGLSSRDTYPPSSFIDWPIRTARKKGPAPPMKKNKKRKSRKKKQPREI